MKTKKKLEVLLLNQSFSMDYPIGLYINNNMEIIRNMASIIKDKYKDKSIALWCMGSSGAIISGIVSSLIDNDVAINHIKKPGESSHNNSSMVIDKKVNIIIDDFIATGATIKNIADKMTIYRVKIDTICISGYVNDKMIKNISTKTLICGEFHNTNN